MKVHENPPLPPATPPFSKSSVPASPGHQEAAGLQAQRGEKEGRCGSSHRRHVNSFDERLVALRSMSGSLHSCVRSGFQSADSCSNTIKDDVIIITSVNARKCACRSTAGSNNCNTPRSRTLLQLPFRYGSVCKRQRNELQSFQHFQNKTLVFCFLSVKAEASSLFLEQAMHFYTGRALILSHVSIVGGTVLLHHDGNVPRGKPNHHSCCSAEFLFITSFGLDFLFKVRT